MQYAFFTTSKEGNEIAGRLLTVYGGKILRISDVREAFARYDVLVFITAASTAIRLLSPMIESQAPDPAVLVLDQDGKYVIPLLAGQVGNANELASEFAAFLGAQAVITTSSDIASVVSFEDVALRNGLAIENSHALKKIGALLLQGASIELHTDHDVAWETLDPTAGSIRVLQYDAEDARMIRRGYQMCAGEDIPAVFLTSRDLSFDEEEMAGHRDILILRPHDIVIGVSCRSRSNNEYVYSAVLDILKRQNIPESSINRLATSTLKSQEPAITDLAVRMGVPLVTVEGEELRKVSFLFMQTPFVQKGQSTETVAAASAYLASDRGRMLMVRSSFPGGVMLAVAQERRKILL